MPTIQPEHGSTDLAMQAADDPWIGRTLKKYTIECRLGQGGMGVVYLARDTVLKRPVAIKLISDALNADTKSVQRFMREAQSAARLQHGNVVALYDVDQDQGVTYLVMEWVPGPTAQQLLDRHGPLPWRVAVQIAADACRGLVAAHASGLIHRDIKPANVLVSRHGEAKVGDFGLAKSSADQTAITQGRYPHGTAQYMSPEQASGEDLDDRADVYSLGATLYALLTGEPPFPGKEWYATLYAHRAQPVPDPRQRNAETPAACVRIIEKAMAKRRVDRYASAAAMLADLEAVRGQEREPLGALAEPFAIAPPVEVTARSTPSTARSRPRWRHARLAAGLLLTALSAAGVAALLCIGAVAWYWRPGPQPQSPSPEQLQRDLAARNPRFDGSFKSLQQRDGQIIKLALNVEGITDIEPVGRLVELEELELYVGPTQKTALTNCDVLGGLTSLRRLRISGCPVEKFDFVSNLRSLTHLYLGGTRLSDLAMLHGLPIVELEVGATQVKSLDGIQGLPLEKLELSNCYRLASLDGVPTKKLRWLSFCSTPVPSLAPLKDAVELEYLDLHWAEVTRCERPNSLAETPTRSLDADNMAILLGLTKLREVHGEFTDLEKTRLQARMQPPRMVRVTVDPHRQGKKAS